MAECSRINDDRGDPMTTVRFIYVTGIKRALFRDARLSGTWNSWGDMPMREIVAEDGCRAFEVTVDFDNTLAGQEIRWDVRLDGPEGGNQWGIATEDSDLGVIRTERHMILPEAGGQATARYQLTISRFLGAQKFYQGGEERIRFAVWAPNAKNVEVVFGTKDSGYIHDDGNGIDPNQPVIQLHNIGDGIWASVPQPTSSRSWACPTCTAFKTRRVLRGCEPTSTSAGR